LDADVGLGQTNKWLDTEDEILDKVPQLDSEKIKVIVPSMILVH
jgi:hypothetical protein